MPTLYLHNMACTASSIVCLVAWSLISLLGSRAISGVVSSFEAGSSRVSFPLTYVDAESSLVRSVEADPADLPVSMPMRRFVAAGRALSVRVEKQRKRPLLRSTLSYEGEPAGDFYLTIPVGTPPQNLIFLVDTGSEFSWCGCSPCTFCNGTEAPFFAFSKSSSLVSVLSDDLLCKRSVGLEVAPGPCTSTDSELRCCTFGVQYGDGSQDMGLVAVDSFGLGSHFSKPFVFGCATYVLNTVPTSSAGLIGLNAGPFSFTSQLFSSNPHMPNRFAYCLPDRFESLNAPGTIEFGNYELPAKLRYTPFMAPYSPLGDLYYFVDLQGITVGEHRINAGVTRARTGGTIFDSGSALTTLVKPVYDKLVKELKRQTSHLHPFALKEQGLDLCYNVSAQSEELPNVPMVVLHFAGEVDLELQRGSLLSATNTDGKTVTLCLAFMITSSDLNIIGNYQQQNYWVEYNLQISSLGLAKAPRCGE